MATTETNDRDFSYEQHRLENVKPLCLEAIDTMRRFLADAEREVKRDSATPEDAIAATTTKIGWGFANASGHLASALSALEDVRKIRDAQSGARR